MATAQVPIDASVEVTVTPKAEPVGVGLQTITGYAGVGAIVATAVLGQADVLGLPSWATVALIGIAAGLGAITNRNRSDQKAANTKAAGEVAAAALAPVAVRELASGASVPAAVDVTATPPLPEPDGVQRA